VPVVEAVGLPEGLHCSMTRWVEGRRYFRKDGPGVRVLWQVGRIMARMHRHAEDFVSPQGFHCPVWNWERLFKESPAATIAEAERRMPDEGRHLVRETEQRIGGVMDRLGTGRDVFGVIHGDLIQANYLIHGGEVRVIDFADFGYGHFLYDTGSTLFGLWGLDEDQQQRKAFLSGYREVRPLSPAHEASLDLFIAARAVVQARFALTSQHPADQRNRQPVMAKIDLVVLERTFHPERRPHARPQTR
jgi:Ser/Thr protein kinase RdoA (MazF antagonist)